MDVFFWAENNGKEARGRSTTKPQQLSRRRRRSTLLTDIRIGNKRLQKQRMLLTSAHNMKMEVENEVQQQQPTRFFTSHQLQALESGTGRENTRKRKVLSSLRLFAFKSQESFT